MQKGARENNPRTVRVSVCETEISEKNNAKWQLENKHKILQQEASERERDSAYE